jgi:hypothetical protein
MQPARAWMAPASPMRSRMSRAIMSGRGTLPIGVCRRRLPRRGALSSSAARHRTARPRCRTRRGARPIFTRGATPSTCRTCTLARRWTATPARSTYICPRRRSLRRRARPGTCTKATARVPRLSTAACTTTLVLGDTSDCRRPSALLVGRRRGRARIRRRRRMIGTSPRALIATVSTRTMPLSRTTHTPTSVQPEHWSSQVTRRASQIRSMRAPRTRTRPPRVLRRPELLSSPHTGGRSVRRLQQAHCSHRHHCWPARPSCYSRRITRPPWRIRTRSRRPRGKSPRLQLTVPAPRRRRLLPRSRTRCRSRFAIRSRFAAAAASARRPEGVESRGLPFVRAQITADSKLHARMSYDG